MTTTSALDDPRVQDPRRTACSAIAGYLYQAAWTVQRWLELGADDVLLCEGDEDLDRRLRGNPQAGLSEQVKHYQKLDARDFRGILANFVRGYVALQQEGKARRYLLTASCNRLASKPWNTLLPLWQDEDQRGGAAQQIAGAVLDLLAPEQWGTKGPPANLAESLGWLGEAGSERWADFVEAVGWNFGAPDLPEALANIDRALRGRTQLPRELLTRALLSEVLEVSAHRDPAKRVLTLGGLDGWLDSRQERLEGWARERAAVWLGELLERERLLDPKTWSVEPGLELLPGQMVQAQYQQVRFDESIRQRELQLLADSEAADRRIDLVVLTGEGGIGKTRLLIEWCNRLRDRAWQAGFLADEVLNAREFPAILLAPGPPRHFVVDYAESRVRGIERLLAQIHKRKEAADCPLVRVVLLARQDGPWWQSLREDSPPEVRDLLLRLGTILHEAQALPDSRETRQAQYDLARASFKANYPDAAAELPVDLSDPRYRNVLLVHMKAVLDLAGQKATVAEDILHAFLQHEADYWRKAMEQQGLSHEVLKSPLRRCLALLTLAGGTDAGADHRLRAIISTALEDASDEDPSVKGHLQRLIGRLYGVTVGQGKRHRPLEPDLLGEQLVWEVYGHAKEALPPHVTKLLAGEQAAALELLVRLCSREVRAHPHLEYLLKTYTREASQFISEPQLRQQLLDALDSLGSPAPVFAAELACALTQEAIDRLDPESSDYLPGLAGLKNNLGARLSDLGRREDALAAAEEARGIYAQLAATRPDAFLPDLAMSLNNLGAMLRDLGRREDALAAAEEAVRALRQHFLAQPRAFARNMSIMANNYLRRCAELGLQPDEALLGPIVAQFEEMNADASP